MTQSVFSLSTLEAETDREKMKMKIDTSFFVEDKKDGDTKVAH